MFEDLKPHLVELRKRLGLSVASVLVLFIVAFSFNQSILAWITKPLNDALDQVGIIITDKDKKIWETNHETNATLIESTKIIATIKLQKNLEKASVQVAPLDSNLSNYLKEASLAAKKLESIFKEEESKPKADASSGFLGRITTHQVAGTLFVAIKVAFFAALLGALPFILYQIWLFVAPGLYDNEKKMIIPFVLGGSIMFFSGVLFAYYVVTPFGFQFLITFGAFLYTPLINIEDYVGFFTKILMGFGIAFELPVFAYFLALLGLITDRTLIDFFKYAVVIIFVVAALLTPPDVITQLLMALPLIFLYGISILIVKMVNPEKKNSENQNAA
ncbi:MAG: twin-arginine translocase subunit TatC [Campylobacterales bacterium]|nr:twin-arginine translocase subunit TatC [Campylobacterales bacterium]